MVHLWFIYGSSMVLWFYGSMVGSMVARAKVKARPIDFGVYGTVDNPVHRQKRNLSSLKSEDLFPGSPEIKRNLQHQPVRFIKFKIRRFITCGRSPVKEQEESRMEIQETMKRQVIKVYINYET
ncbi:hypothetical protein O3M35_010384 [Rhynocoris fuscipes]|uniref:Uncharacterized protein n=1 Tax=Rhynocoris fuscipes TaxID=488301 RepID=A0AAW1CZP0_9HEMI